MKRLAALLCTTLGCGPTATKLVETETTPPPRASHHEPYPKREAAAALCAQMLRDGRFDEARQNAATVLAGDDGNPQALVVQAITRYKAAAQQLALDVITISDGLFRRRGQVNHQYGRWAMGQAATALAETDRDLAIAAEEPKVTLELCLACWRIDWNRNGREDPGDDRMLQVELDADGNRLASDDPRRKPTFKFDVGDLHWARAAIAFQRAAIELLLAYRWTEIESLVKNRGGPDGTITIHLDDKRRVGAARALLLAGLDEAERARRAYLAETDDDREWVPNPRQQSHPLPLPVDDALFETWEAIIGDLRHIVRGDEGLEIAQIAQLGDNKWEDPPRGFLDVGTLLKEPKDITLDLERIGVLGMRRGNHQTRTSVEESLASVLGSGYQTTMRSSRLITRLERMKGEIKLNGKEFERKFKYMLWLN